MTIARTLSTLGLLLALGACAGHRTVAAEVDAVVNDEAARQAAVDTAAATADSKAALAAGAAAATHETSPPK